MSRRSAFDEGRGSPVIGESRGDEGSSPLTVGEPSVHTRALAVDFLVADAPAKCTLVEKLAKPPSLVPANFANTSVVDEEHVAMVEVRLSLSHLFFICHKIPLTKCLGYFLDLCSCTESSKIEVVRFHLR